MAGFHSDAGAPPPSVQRSKRAALNDTKIGLRGTDPANTPVVAFFTNPGPNTTVTIAGDSHGTGSYMTNVCDAAVRSNSPVIFQTGDFGYWTHERSGRHFLDRLQKHLEKRGLVLFFLRGNHENQDGLEALTTLPCGVAPIRPNIAYVPDGTIWEWNSVRFAVYGGAVSVDKGHREIFKDWWPNEDAAAPSLVFPDKQEYLTNPVDVLLTHDAPDKVDLSTGFVPPIEIAEQCSQTRANVTEVVRLTGAKLVVHGHHHRGAHNLVVVNETVAADPDHSYSPREVHVRSLAADVNDLIDAVVLLELPSKTLRPLQQ